MAVAKLNYIPKTLREVSEFLGGKSQKKIAHNTYLVMVSDSLATITFHGNVIAQYTPKTVKVSLAGWDTMTTRGRVGQITWALAGVHCGRIRGVTYMGNCSIYNGSEVYNVYSDTLGEW